MDRDEEMLVRLLTPEERAHQVIQEAIYHAEKAARYRQEAAREQRIYEKLLSEAQRIKNGGKW